MAEHLSERQKAWFASIKSSFERDTGQPLEHWLEVARHCPETKHRARLKWFKDQHGLGVNRASTVLSIAFPDGPGWDEPDALRAQLWADPGSLAVLEAVERAAADLPDLIVGQRKTYTAFTRAVQFAAMRPLKGGGAVLGLKLPPDGGRRAPRGRESWADKLTSSLRLDGAEAVDAEVAAWFREAYAG